MFTQIRTDPNRLSLRLLAGLGDAVNSLIEREKGIACTHSAKQLHNWTKQRVNAKAQASNLERLLPVLNEQEQDLVRRAINLKSANYRKTGQSISRQSTAYEILLGYLYISDLARLKELMALLEANETSNS